MKGYKLVVAGFALGTLLTACGGSGGDDGTISIVEGNVTGKLVYDTSCGSIPAKDIEVLVHDSEGKIIHRELNDSKGEFSVIWNSNSTHVSFIDDDINRTTLVVRSMLDVNLGDLGVISMGEAKANRYSLCECVSGRFDTSEIYGVYPNTVLMPEPSFHVCKRDGQYPKINLALVSSQDGVAPIAASININKLDDVDDIKLTAEDFAGDDHVGKLLTLEGLKGGDKLTSGNTNVMKGLDDRFSWEKANGAYSFSSLIKDEYLSSVYSNNLLMSDARSIFYLSGHTQKLSDGILDYRIDTNREPMQILQAIEPLMEGLQASQATSYDFTQLEQDVSIIAFEFAAHGWRWSIEGPALGTLPTLDLPSQVVDKIELSSLSSGAFGITLGSSKGLATYQDYRAEWAKVSRNDSLLPDAGVSMLRISATR